MDRFTRTEFDRLASFEGGPCVSIYMPTPHQGHPGREAQIRLKNLLREAQRRLLDQGGREDEAERLLGPALRFLQGDGLWDRLSHGLALFIAEEELEAFRLPEAFEESVAVEPRFRLTPLLPFALDERRFFLFALSASMAQLYECDRYSIQAVEAENLPASIDDVLKFRDPEKSLQHHTGASGGDAMFHGQGSGKDDENAVLLEYFQGCDRALHARLADESAPLVLAALDENAGLYRKANSYRFLAEKTIPSNPAELTADELQRRGYEIVKPDFDKKAAEAIDRFAALKPKNQATSDLKTALRAAVEGRVETLLLSSGGSFRGKVDPETGKAQVWNGDREGGEDLLNFAALQTIQHGGKAYVLAPEELPANPAAIFRF